MTLIKIKWLGEIGWNIVNPDNCGSTFILPKAFALLCTCSLSFLYAQKRGKGAHQIRRTFNVVTSSVNNLSYAVSFEAGGFYEGKRRAVNISSLLNLTLDLIFEAGVDYNLLDIPDLEDLVSIRYSSPFIRPG